MLSMTRMMKKFYIRYDIATYPSDFTLSGI